MNSPHLSIILPCYNPIIGWVDVVKNDVAFLKEAGLDFELIVVNDGSTNALPENIQQTISGFCNAKFITYEKNQGKGFAIRKGVESSSAELIIYTDIDFPYTRESFLCLYSELCKNNDVVIGIRPASYYYSLPKSRVLISKVLRFFIRFLLRIPTDDTQCGLKGFNQKGKAVFLKTQINRYLFDMEFITLAAREKLIIKTCEVNLKPGIILSKIPLKVLLHEAGNFLKIFFR